MVKDFQDWEAARGASAAAAQAAITRARAGDRALAAHRARANSDRRRRKVAAAGGRRRRTGLWIAGGVAAALAVGAGAVAVRRRR